MEAKLTSNAESSSKHPHSHDLPSRNPHANISPAERLERLFMFLEAQFGADNLNPIAIPKVTGQKLLTSESLSTSKDDNGDATEGSKDEDSELEELQRQEIERLHQIGIPVPGVEIKVDKMVAKVWLEDLEVECANRVFGDRVRAVVERAVEVTAPLWA
jgi:cleavage and polyadenylation specificity factor subunit 3